jgi:hypothetical protein
MKKVWVINNQDDLLKYGMDSDMVERLLDGEHDSEDSDYLIWEEFEFLDEEIIVDVWIKKELLK